MFEREKRPRDSRDEHRAEGRSFTDRVRDLARAEFDWIFAKDGAVADRLLAGSVPGSALALDPPVSDVPVSGFPGQVIRVAVEDAAAPWLCVWDAALNGGAGGWSVVGGAPLRDVVAASEGTTSTTYTDLSTPGPAVTIPCPGVYDVAIEADTRTSNATYLAIMSIAGPGVAAGGEPLLLHGQGPGTSPVPRVSLAASDRVTFTAAGVVAAKYQSNNAAATATFQRRRLSATPIELRP